MDLAYNSGAYDHGAGPLVSCVLRGEYEIRLNASLELGTKYHIITAGPVVSDLYDIYWSGNTELLGTYHILLGNSLEGVYTIDAIGVLDYRILVGTKILVPGDFYNLKMVKKLNQAQTLGLDFIPSLAPVDTIPLIHHGQGIDVLYNGVIQFSGEIRSVEKNDGSGIWSLYCEGGSCYLSDRTTEKIIEHKGKSVNSIITPMLPPGVKAGDIDTGPLIDYKTEYTDILSHLVNLANVTGFEWMIGRQTARYTLTSGGGFHIGVDGAPWTVGEHVGHRVLFLNGVRKWAVGTITENSTNELTTDLLDIDPPYPGPQAGDQILVIGDYMLDFKERIGSVPSTVTLTINETIFNSYRTQDISRIRNRIVVTGVSSLTQDRNSVISGYTLKRTTLTAGETYLSQNISSTDTIIYVVTTAGYPNSGNILIDAEVISYTSLASNCFQGCTRGASRVGHNIYAGVLRTTDLDVADGMKLAASGTVWIGIERIAYTSRSASKISGLTRGYGSTPSYPHLDGIVVQSSDYSSTSPEEGSSIALNGVREKLVPALGVTDQNTLDRLAQAQLIALEDIQEWGEGYLASTSMHSTFDVGDTITLEEPDATASSEYRLMGMAWDQMQGMVMIQFGAAEEYFLDDLSRLRSGIDIANSRGAVASMGKIMSVSDNSEVADVELDSGRRVWCRIK